MMKDAQWLAYRGEPKGLLVLLGHRASKRKRRLFGCACCRRIWHLIGDERSRWAVGVAERFADGLATDEELTAAWTAALDVAHNPFGHLGAPAAWACTNVAHQQAGIAVNASYNALDAVQAFTLGDRPHGPWTLEVQALRNQPWDEECATQCQLVRDIFGNPFRPLPPKIGNRVWEEQKSGWLAWNEGVVWKLAQSIYDDGAFNYLPVLADALEEAGCHDTDILAHCRGQGPHVRGCWVVDLLLGKE
jgi:hypothetical protein